MTEHARDWQTHNEMLAAAEAEERLWSAIGEAFARGHRPLPPPGARPPAPQSTSRPVVRPPGLDEKRGPPCKLLPSKSTSTNPAYLFLHEIGGAECLKPFLDSINLLGPKSPHWGGTLVVDEPVPLTAPLTVPSHFTLAGPGMTSVASLLVPDDLPGPAVTFAPGGYSTLRDIKISTDNLDVWPFKPDGIHVRGSGPIFLDRVEVFGLGTGILGAEGSSIYVHNCVLDFNVIHISIRAPSTHWRIRNCEIRFSWINGVRIVKAQDVMIEGCICESNGTFFLDILNPRGAIWNAGLGVGVFGNRFEGNSNLRIAVHAGPDLKPKATPPTATRFLCNLSSLDQVTPGDADLPLQDGDALNAAPKPLDVHIGFNSQVDYGNSPNHPFPLDLVLAPHP